MSFHDATGLDASSRSLLQGLDFTNLKKRGYESRSWIQIDQNGNSHVLALDKGTLMKRCNLPARDLRLLDPLFVYPSTILGREKAIVVNLEQIRCIIMADEVLLLNSLDCAVVHYESELCKRLQSQKDRHGKNKSHFVEYVIWELQEMKPITLAYLRMVSDPDNGCALS
ncbi:Magnesium transporter MRS2-5 [Asimina triloba]